MEALGELVRKARLTAGLTARELARLLSLSHSYISQLESGGIVSPSPGVLRKLSDALESLDFRRLLVAAGYLSRIDELGDDEGAQGVKRRQREIASESNDRRCDWAVVNPSKFRRESESAGATLIPHHNPELADRLVAAVSGKCEVASRASRGERRIPLLGAIPAGSAPTAQVGELDALQTIPLPTGIRGVGPFAAMRVLGDSMVDAGILDGDIVILDRGTRVRNGDVCAVLVDCEHPTLKSVYSTADIVVLAPANRAYAPIIVKTAELDVTVRILGKVIHCSRYY
jgi:SOS-response transcriptional repressor LexA